MRVNFDHATHETIVRLTQTEAFRLVAALCNLTNTSPDYTAGESVQVEEVLTELLT
jgi:hypothetical protein